jgi:cobalt-zinc-cadmium efflux system outer membrane protein
MRKHEPSWTTPAGAVAFLGAAALLTAAQAQVPAPKLSLADAVAAAERAAPVVAAAGDARAERERVATVRRPGDPQVGLGTTRYSGNRIVTLSEDIRWAGQRSHAVAAAEHGAEAAELDARQTLAETRHEARARWFALARAEDAATIAQAVVDRERHLRDSIAERVEGGRVARLDLVRANAEVASLEAAAAGAEEERAAAWSDLAGLLGLADAPAGTTDGTRPAAAPPEILDAEAAPSHAERQPAVVAARARVAAAEANVSLAGSRRLPGLGVEVSATAGDPGLPGTDTSATLNLKIPLSGSPEEAAAIAERDAARARLDDAVRTARAHLAAALHRARGARAALAAYDSSAVPAAQEAADLTREAFDAGRGDLARLLEVERASLEARQARLEAYVAAQNAWGDLLLASGGEDHGQ